MRRLPSLKAVQAFEAAARLESFARAAQELQVTPSAISHQVRLLEAALGVSLFHRAHRAVSLSDVGARYAGDIAAAFGAIERATEEIAGSAKADILSVHSVPSFAAQWLMPRLSRFSALYPDIDVRLNASATPADLTAGPTDIDITYGRVLNERAVRVTPFPAEVVAPLCAPALLAPHPKPWTPALLRQLPLIHSEANLLPWRDWLAHFKIEEVALDRGLRFDRSFMSISAAVDGLGVCLESVILAEREIAAGRLIVPFCADGPTIRGHNLVTLRSRARLRKIEAFETWLFDEMGRRSNARTGGR